MTNFDQVLRHVLDIFRTAHFQDVLPPRHKLPANCSASAHLLARPLTLSGIFPHASDSKVLNNSVGKLLKITVLRCVSTFE